MSIPVHRTTAAGATSPRPALPASIARQLARPAVLLTLIGIGFSRLAGATCAVPDLQQLPGLHASPEAASYALLQAVYRPGANLGARAVPIDFHFSPPPSIVGMWQFKFSPDLGGDFGTLIWHEDGTETMISAARDPAAGDICMGVWKQTGRYTYELNHIAMGHDGPPGGPPSPTFTNTVHLHEYIRLDPSGDGYTGHVDAVISAANPGDPFDESNVIAQVSGTVTARRVQP